MSTPQDTIRQRVIRGSSPSRHRANPITTVDYRSFEANRAPKMVAAMVDAMPMGYQVRGQRARAAPFRREKTSKRQVREES